MYMFTRIQHSFLALVKIEQQVNYVHLNFLLFVGIVTIFAKIVINIKPQLDRCS